MQLRRVYGLAYGNFMTSMNNIANYHYLVVDNHSLTSALIVNMLSAIDAVDIDIAENGEMALNIIDAGKIPDIIITDLNMPQLDGVSLMRHLAERKFAGGIVLASNSDKRIMRMAVNLAAAHHLNILGALSKPFTLPALQNLLDSFDGVKEAATRRTPPSSLVTPEALLSAIEQDQLVPFFQPKILIKTGVTTGVEALARWHHPERGLIPPNLFIPVAEEHGMIQLLTDDMLFKTLKQAAIWHENDMNLNFAINFAASSFSDIDLPNRIEAQLKKFGINPAYLTMEITESGLCDNLLTCQETLLRLRLKGMHLSIDDFGTGHSSLEELHRIPFSELKIDRVFVNGAPYDEEALLFMQSAVSLAKKLGLNIVAEGVETQNELDVCTKLNCDQIQGFMFGRPMPAEAFLTWYNTKKNILKKTRISRLRQSIKRQHSQID